MQGSYRETFPVAYTSLWLMMMMRISCICSWRNKISLRQWHLAVYDRDCRGIEIFTIQRHAAQWSPVLMSSSILSISVMLKNKDIGSWPPVRHDFHGFL